MENKEIENSQDLSFSYGDILSEIRRMKEECKKKMLFTDEQMKLIKEAREGEYKISWEALSKLFKRSGIVVCPKTLRRKYDEQLDS